jgi:hypothetical protein
LAALEAALEAALAAEAAALAALAAPLAAAFFIVRALPALLEAAAPRRLEADALLLLCVLDLDIILYIILTKKI